MIILHHAEVQRASRHPPIHHIIVPYALETARCLEKNRKAQGNWDVYSILQMSTVAELESLFERIPLFKRKLEEQAALMLDNAAIDALWEKLGGHMYCMKPADFYPRHLVALVWEVLPTVFEVGHEILDDPCNRDLVLYISNQPVCTIPSLPFDLRANQREAALRGRHEAFAKMLRLDDPVFHGTLNVPTEVTKQAEREVEALGNLPILSGKLKTELVVLHLGTMLAKSSRSHD